LLVLAVAEGYVSFRAQYSFVHAIKRERWASMLEALGLDAAAVIFALLGLAQARLGRPALAERALNLACVGGSLAMNALPATITDPQSVAAWIMPAMLYAAASDRLIAVVRRHALARTPTATDQRSAYTAVGGAALWLVRLALAPPSTFFGFRNWVLVTAPLAPGLPPHLQPAASTGKAPATTPEGMSRAAPSHPQPPADQHAGQPTYPDHSPRRDRSEQGGGDRGILQRPWTSASHAEQPTDVTGSYPNARSGVAAAAPGAGPHEATYPTAYSRSDGAHKRAVPVNGGRDAHSGVQPSALPADSAVSVVGTDALSPAWAGPTLGAPIHHGLASGPFGNGLAGDLAGGAGSAPAGGHVGGLPGESKRALLVRLYDAAGAAGDPRHHTREGVGPMAKQLHTQAGLARASTARNYLHNLLDQRGIPPRQPTKPHPSTNGETLDDDAVSKAAGGW
jgi:hypothetical protein